MPVLKVGSKKQALGARFVRSLGRSMRMRMVAKMRTLLLCDFLMLAIVGSCSPGCLEQQQQCKQEGDAAAHKKSISRVCLDQRSPPARSSRKPLKTTSRLAPMSANTAIHMVALPNTARTKNTALMPSASEMFCQSTA